MFHIDVTCEDVRMIATQVEGEFSVRFIEGKEGKEITLQLTFEETCDVLYLGLHPDVNNSQDWYDKPTIQSYQAKLDLALSQKSEATGRTYSRAKLSFIP